MLSVYNIDHIYHYIDYHHHLNDTICIEQFPTICVSVRRKPLKSFCQWPMYKVIAAIKNICSSKIY